MLQRKSINLLPLPTHTVEQDAQMPCCSTYFWYHHAQVPEIKSDENLLQKNVFLPRKKVASPRDTHQQGLQTTVQILRK
jgi:hypothetical protein